ncbi:hypothetical protein [Burkholderia vietnamiensis]|uniref:hypothetical protein n=1 Tax=Burkholderia vietnamiensis TaxID=60552 RepID=UPI00352FEE2D
MTAAITAAVVGGGALIGSSLINSNSASSAADTQASAAQAGIDEQKYQFDKIQGLLVPYVNMGYNSINGYQNALTGYQTGIDTYNKNVGQYSSTLGQLNNLTGANGTKAQQTAINGLKSNPMYTSAMQLGQQAILANASATGGLRGGNTIASLGYLPGQVLSNVMGSQIGNLGTSLNATSGLLNANTGALNAYANYAGLNGNLLSLGENAAAMTGNAGLTTGNNITNLLGQAGAAQAGGTLGTSNAITSGLNGFSSLLGSSTGQNALQSLFGGSSGSGSGGYNFYMPAAQAGGISYGLGSGLNYGG